MVVDSFGPPSGLFRQLKRKAPLKTVSENWGRSGGFYGDSDVSTRLYRHVLVYIEMGLGGEEETFKQIAKLLDKVQPRGGAYNLLLMSYGYSGVLTHDGRAIPIRGRIIPGRLKTFLDTCAKLGGQTPAMDLVVSALFPKTDMRSLYTGKVAVDRNDLLVFVHGSKLLMFSETAAVVLRRFRKQVLDVSVRNDMVEWVYPVNEISVSV